MRGAIARLLTVAQVHERGWIPPPPTVRRPASPGHLLRTVYPPRPPASRLELARTLSSRREGQTRLDHTATLSTAPGHALDPGPVQCVQPSDAHAVHLPGPVSATPRASSRGARLRHLAAPLRRPRVLVIVPGAHTFPSNSLAIAHASPGTRARTGHRLRRECELARCGRRPGPGRQRGARRPRAPPGSR